MTFNPTIDVTGLIELVGLCATLIGGGFALTVRIERRLTKLETQVGNLLQFLGGSARAAE